ncbi:TVP38/TMEM64 family protein [Peptacetobacter sp.]|uniref:TVP38/TMEM64 family protein n=1 Tax=Peptacetobacter sp. TaxID=2991975 RepID=UPI0026224878|nr:VTT domain-containing protein [Peptacetobacter sp.]
MEYIQNLLYIAQDNIFLSIAAGLFSAFIESFLPALPLVAIVSANAAILGMIKGLIISWIGSGLGTTGLFLIVSKFRNIKILKWLLKNNKVDSIIDWVDKKGFSILFLAYACPFMPSCRATLASALCGKKKLIDFIPPMLSGKFVMFVIISYISEDIIGFIHNPIKIALFLGLTLISWIIGKRFNKKLEMHEEEIEAGLEKFEENTKKIKEKKELKKELKKENKREKKNKNR